MYGAFEIKLKRRVVTFERRVTNFTGLGSRSVPEAARHRATSSGKVPRSTSANRLTASTRSGFGASAVVASTFSRFNFKPSG
jgi:hypothetical protein